MNQEPLPQIHLIRDTDLSIFAYELHIFAGDFLRECEFNMRSLATNTGADSIAIMGKNHMWLSDALFAYLRGECYGFELYKNGELSDSCWGFMGNFSDVLKDMAAYLPDECKGMVDHLEEQERPATIIKTLLKHAKIQVDQAAKAFEHASRQQVLGESR